MISKNLKLTLRQKNDFFQNSQKKFSPLFTLFFQKNQPATRFLVIIPKKNINKATARNQAKRRIYNILAKKINILYKTNLVIVLKKDIKEITDLDLEKILIKEINKI